VTQVRKEKGVAQETQVLKVPLVSLVSKESQVTKVIRERLALKEKRVLLVSQDVTEQMGRRVKLDGLVLPAAKETQATGVLMVTPEMLVSVVSLELLERREILDALEDLVPLAHRETLDQRERVEVLDHLVFLEKKGTQGPLDFQEAEESRAEEETTGPKVLKGQMELREKRVKWGRRV